MATAARVAFERQGEHLDPLVTRAITPESWTPLQREAASSQEMELFRQCLLLPGKSDIRASVIDDLATYYGISESEAVARCLRWEQDSVAEWQARPRDTVEAITDFYLTQQSWAFDLLWYAYLQAEGYEYPLTVVVARQLARRSRGPVLDFGSGVGAAAQLYGALGFEPHLADVSTPLLDFARFRLERRGQSAEFLDLNTTAIPRRTFVGVTAIDTLVHVPDHARAARDLHAALRPGGLLFANYDARPRTPENAWHLYEDDLPLRWQLQRTGFEPARDLDGMITEYRRVEPQGPAHAARGARDAVLLRSPLRPAYRRARTALHRVRARR